MKFSSRCFKLWLVLGLVAVLGVGMVAKPILARDPVPEGVTSYYGQIFKPAIASQDVNLQSTVFEIFLSLVSSMQEALFECDDVCLEGINREGIGLPPGGDAGTAPDLASANRPSGLIPWLFQTNASFLSRPAVSSTDYIAHVGEKLHLVNPAYAQGIGFGYAGLAPARGLWTAFRNIAYLLATIGFVVLSFMIMFRLKISAQTVIGAQQAIMKLVVVFLAVTFSYAIAGLLVDLLFVLSFVIITLFVSAGIVPGSPSASELQVSLFSGNIMTKVGELFTVAGTAGQHLDNLIKGLIAEQLGGGAVGALVGAFFGEGFSAIGSLIIGIAIVYAMFRLLFALLFAYLEILLLTIMAPILILPDVFPGGKAFVGWTKRLFANAMVFPTTTFMLLLGMAIVGNADAPGILQTADGPQGLQLPYIGLPQDAVQPFLGVGMILMTYKVVDMVKNALKVSAFQYSSAIGAALGYGAAKAAPFYQAPFQPISTARSAVGALGRVPFIGDSIAQQSNIAQRNWGAWEKGKTDKKGGLVEKPGLGTRFMKGVKT